MKFDENPSSEGQVIPCWWTEVRDDANSLSSQLREISEKFYVMSTHGSYVFSGQLSTKEH